MKPLLCMLGMLLFAVVPPNAADEKPAKPNTLTAKEAADGWVLLFDGETAFGWKVAGPALVQDGAAVLGGDKETSVTSSSAFKAFELRFEYRVAGTGQAKLVLESKTEVPLRDMKGWTKANIKYGPNQLVQEFVSPDGTAAPVSQPVPDGIGRAAAPIRFDIPAGAKLEIKSVMLKPTGLESIFNGKDLTGWKVIPGHKSEFGVNDKGELTIKNGNGDIQTEGQWDDFALQVDIFSNGPHLNSGVFFRCLPGEFWSGYEAQIRNEWVTDVVLKDGTKLTGSLTIKGDDAALQVYKVEGKRANRTKEFKKFAKADIEQTTDHRDIPIDFGTGAIYNRQAARMVVSNDYEWYTMTIVANGKHLAVWVNGYQTADYTDAQPPNKSARKGSKVDKGPISLQGHDPTTDLSFRNIRIAELPKAATEK